MQVWNRSADLVDDEFRVFWGWLSGDERDRADRFHFSRDRTAFVAARGWLREVLSGYLDRPPASLVFDYGPFGRPSLAGETWAELDFNLSHSQGCMLLAVASGFRVGIDVEHVRPVEDGVARHVFSEREIAALAALPEARRLDGFFRCWTRKEAYVKALGSGLSAPLDGFDVSLAPGEPARLLHVAHDRDEAQRWRIEHLEPRAGYVGAVAARALDWSVAWMEGGKGR